MNGTVTIIYRPNDGTEEMVLVPIKEFAERAETTRRQIDRMAEDGDVERIKIPDLTYIPAKYLSLFPLQQKEHVGERPRRREQQTGGPSTGPETEAESAPATPWEELTYEPR